MTDREKRLERLEELREGLNELVDLVFDEIVAIEHELTVVTAQRDELRALARTEPARPPLVLVRPDTADPHHMEPASSLPVLGEKPCARCATPFAFTRKTQTLCGVCRKAADMAAGANRKRRLAEIVAASGAPSSCSGEESQRATD